MRKRKLIMLVLFWVLAGLMVFVFFGCTAKTPEPQPETSSVPETVAFPYAAIALLEHVVIPPPSLFYGERAPRAWEAVTLGDATSLYDVNGEPLLYSYPLLDSSPQAIGSIWIAANKSLGATVIAIRQKPKTAKIDQQIDNVLAVAKSKYPD